MLRQAGPSSGVCLSSDAIQLSLVVLLQGFAQVSFVQSPDQ